MTTDAEYFAWFHSLAVEGVRTFAEKQALLLHRDDVPAQWTILLGDNGTGKSTLLQMLAQLRPSTAAFAADHGLEPYLEPAGANQGWRSSLRPPDDPAWSCTVDIRFSFSRTRVEAAALRAGYTECYRPEEVGAPYLVEPTTSLESLGFVQSVVIGYGPFRRLRRGAALSASGGHGPSVESLFDADAGLVPAEEWLLQRDYAVLRMPQGSPERARAKESYDRVKRLLLALLPEVEDLEVVIADPAAGAAELRAHTPYGKVPLHDLGQGYQSTLAWVVDLAARLTAAYAFSENPLAEPAVVLVDEIDLHLHPRWQRQLLEQLSQRFPNVQWIVTAHSPLIVQNAPPDARIVVLRRDGDHVVIDNDPDHVRAWRLDQILTSDLFGLPTARPRALDDLIARRDALLAKSALDDAEQRELGDLDAKLDALPEGEGRVDTEVLRILKEAADAESAG